MDLLTARLARLRTVGALGASAVLLCACGSEDRRPAGGEGPYPTQDAPTTPAATANLSPLRPDEQTVGTEAGQGPTTTSVRGRADDVVIVYGVCTQPGATLSLVLTLPDPEPLSVPCDGVISRAQVFAVPDQPFGLDVDAPAGTGWEVLVTTRAE